MTRYHPHCHSLKAPPAMLALLQSWLNPVAGSATPGSMQSTPYEPFQMHRRDSACSAFSHVSASSSDDIKSTSSSQRSLAMPPRDPSSTLESEYTSLVRIDHDGNATFVKYKRSVRSRNSPMLGAA